MGEPRLMCAPYHLRVLADARALAGAAAELFVELAAEAVRARGRFVVALAGGSTPRAMYELLASPAYRDRVQWQQVHVFFGDERFVPRDHRDSNFRMAREALLGRVGVPQAQVHRVPTELAMPEDAARAYESELRALLGGDAGGERAGATPAATDGTSGGDAGSWQVFRAHATRAAASDRFDLVLLGMGADGHTASLFPGTEVLREGERWVRAPAGEQLGTRRVTLTLPVLGNARAVAFLVAGADKAEALARVLRHPGGELPAARVRPAGDLYWLVDSAAAELLHGRA